MTQVDTVETVSRVTAWFLLVVTVACFVFDLWVSGKYGSESTITWSIYTGSKEWPILPFLLGVLVGHLLWPQRR